MKEETLGEAFVRVLGPEIDSWEPGSQATPLSITEVISDVISSPDGYCDEYVVACVRAQAAMVAVTTAKGFYPEANATIAYAAMVARLKRFW